MSRTVSHTPVKYMASSILLGTFFDNNQVPEHLFQYRHHSGSYFYFWEVPGLLTCKHATVPFCAPRGRVYLYHYMYILRYANGKVSYVRKVFVRRDNYYSSKRNVRQDKADARAKEQRLVKNQLKELIKVANSSPSLDEDELWEFENFEPTVKLKPAPWWVSCD